MSAHNDWAAPGLPSRRLASVDAWHRGRVDVRHFERMEGGSSLRLTLETSLERAHAEKLIERVLDELYGEGPE